MEIGVLGLLTTCLLYVKVDALVAVIIGISDLF